MLSRRRLIAVSALWLLPACAAWAQVPKNVLLLSSESTATPGIAMIADQVAVAVRTVGPANVFVESLDRSQFPSDTEGPLSFYRQRYVTRRIDLVVTLGGPALDFALRHRDELFPAVPILFSFVDSSMVPKLPPSANVSGVFLDPDWRGILDLGLKLHPRVRNVLVVSGASQFDQAWQTSFDLVTRSFDWKVGTRRLAGATLPTLLGEVATLAEDSLVLYVSVSRDGSGAAYTPRDVLEIIRRVSRGPVYGSSSTFMGYGVVGGPLMDLQRHGADVGRMALRVLAGERPDHMTPMTTPNTIVFDWRELKRFGVPESALPAGATVLHRGPGFWSFHPAWIIAAVAVFGGQTALILAMLAHRRKRAILEASLKARLRFETLLSDASSALGGIATSRIDVAFRTSLAALRQYLGVDRVSIFEFTADGRARRTIDEAGPDAPAAPEEYPLSALPTMALTLASLQPFVLERVEDLAEDAVGEREAVQRMQIRSLLLVPLEVGGHTLGALSCVSHTREVAWPADRVQQVRTLGQTLANALQRRITDLAVAESDRLRGAVLASMPAQIAVLDRSGVIIAVNESWLAFGRSNGVRDEAAIAPGASYLAVCARAASEGVETAAQAREGIEAVCEGRTDTYDTEYSLETPDGERWFGMKVVPLRHAKGGAVVTHRDITQAKRHETALRQGEQRYRLLADAQRVLSGRLITAQEDERRRIARELHDDLQQRLALLAMALDSVAVRRQALTPEEAVACARDLWQKTVEISSDMQTLSHRLHPSKLEALGLLRTVQGYCRELSQHGLRVVFTYDEVPEEVPADVALCVFRVVQESLQNALKHSGASEARLTMSGTGGLLRVRIEDRGRGFDTARANGAGLGLVSMRERLHLVGGGLTIESEPGRGTVVDFEVPCREEPSPASSGMADFRGSEERT